LRRIKDEEREAVEALPRPCHAGSGKGICEGIRID
jgi:hypothetical protein